MNDQSLLESFRNAFSGLLYVVSEERNARIHLTVAILVIALGFWLRLDTIEWALIIAAIALVFAGEMLNTVVELTIDLVCPDQHILAKHAKDVAAGAILLGSIAAAVIGFIILGPPLWHKLALSNWL